MSANRPLGFWMSTALVVGNVIGLGVFLLPAALAPYGWVAMPGWLLTVAGCLVLARVFAELARRCPEADGPFDYLRRGLGEWPAFLAAWCYWVSLWITNAALAVGVVGYLDASLPALAVLPAPLMALALLWTMVAINLIGTRAGGGTQVLTTLVKLVPMLLVVVLGALRLGADGAGFTPAPMHGELAQWTPANLLAASTVALFAMLGVESATIPAGRVHDPERTIPRATLTGTLFVGLLYIAVSALPLALIPQDQLAASGAPFVDLIDRMLGAGSGRWIGLFVVVSGLGALNGWTLLVGELTASLARQGSLPAALARNNRAGAPAAALLFTGVLASAMLLMNYSATLAAGFAFLSMVVTAAVLPLYLFCSLALWRLAAPGPAGRLPRGLALTGAAYACIAFAGVGASASLWAAALAVAGLPVLGWRKWRAAVQPAAAR